MALQLQWGQTFPINKGKLQPCVCAQNIGSQRKAQNTGKKAGLKNQRIGDGKGQITTRGNSTATN